MEFPRPRVPGETKTQYERALLEFVGQCLAKEFPEDAASRTKSSGLTQTGSFESPSRGIASSASQMQPARYKKTSGAADGAGESFECKMLTLVFLRMLSTGLEFQLASNMEAAGLFDDIVLRHRCLRTMSSNRLADPDHEWDVSYVQLKHKQNKNKSISKPELLGISGDFSLVKYCASYENMKLSKELLLYGDFSQHEIVIFTNADIDDSLVDVLESDPLLSTGGRVVSFKAGGEVYQGLCEWVGFKEALTELLGQVDGKSGEEVGVKINEALTDVKYKNKAVTSWRDELLKSPTLAKLKDIKKKLSPVRDKATYSSFLSKLRVYTNQAHESQLDAKIKEQLDKVWICEDNLEADAMLHALQSQVKSWWQKDNVYLTENSALWLGVVKSQTELLCKTTIDGLTRFRVEFVESSLQVLLDKIGSVTGILNLRVDSRTAASSLKVHQALAKLGAQENVLHVNLQALLQREDEVLLAWATRWCRVLVLQCDQQLENSKAGLLASKIINVLSRKNENKLLVLIAPEEHELNIHLDQAKCYMRFNDNFAWSDLTEKTKDSIMSIKIRINGSQSMVSLLDLVGEDESFVNKIDLEVISQVIQGDLRLGKDLDEEGELFVTRRLREGASGVPFVVNSASDVGSKVVLVVAEPGMGKSTLMTHLAKSAKAEDPTALIVHIKLNDCSKYLKEMDVTPFNEVTARKFLEQSALSTGKGLEKLLFGFLEDKLVLFIDGIDEVCPHYENQIFTLLNFYKDKQFNQLWVASRPIFQTKLEETLGVKAFCLVAFSEEDQMEFFNKVWSANVPSASPENCQEATASLLTWLTDSLGKDNPIQGVPLMASMIAETFQDRLFTKGGGNEEFKTMKRLDVTSLYKTFVEKKFLRYCVEKKKTSNRHLAAIIDDEETLRKQMHHNHSFAALRLLFTPEEIAGLQFEGKETFDHDLGAYLKEVSKGREKMGIIDNVIDGKPHFIHRSFAEFFTAIWLADNFQTNRKFVEKLFFDPAYRLIREMFDRSLAENHPLHVAVLSRDLQLTKSLLDARPNTSDVNALDKGGRTPLHLAVLLSSTDPHEDCTAILELLIEKHKARLDVADKVLGWVPLRYAEWAGGLLALQVILKNGGVLTESQDGWPRPDPGLILDAARGKSTSVVRYLVDDRGGDLQCRGPKGETMFHRAAEGGNIEVLEFLFSKLLFDKKDNKVMLMYSFFSKISTKRLSFDDTDNEGKSALSYATPRALRYLLTRSLDPQARHDQGLVDLLESAQSGAYETMAALLEAKEAFRLYLPDQASQTHLNVSLLCAAFAGRLESVQKLVQKGARKRHRDNKGHTAAWVAWHRGHYKVMDWLLTRASKEGDMPLHTACRLGEPEMAASLLSRGADIEGKGWWGQTPLIAAARGGRLAVVTLLLDKGANIESRDKYGKTPLHRASLRGHKQVVAMLLSHEADVNVTDNKGLTPLDWATREKHAKVAKLLAAAGGRRAEWLTAEQVFQRLK